MTSIRQTIERRPWVGWLIFLLTVGIVFLLGLLASSIIERRAETTAIAVPEGKFDTFEAVNEKFKDYYPREYQSWLQTSDTGFRSMYGGNAMRDMLEEDPRLVVLWAGYAFSKDYSQGRGHSYAVTDVRNTLRTGAPMTAEEGPMPGTCWSCKSPDVPRMMAEIGPEAFYSKKWAALGHEINNSIGCADCHDPATMNLRISRPGLIEAFERRGEDITKVSHQDMRSLVCAQCHVEYYFKGEGKYLTFPWDKGFTVEQMEEYYDSYEFSDWTHSISKAPMLKAQHPDYELYTMGIHARRDVACADCHMPYKSEGSQKFTDHHIQSPLNNIANSCQVCHREETAEIVASVYAHQQRVVETRIQAEDVIVKAHIEAGAAWEAGATETEMASVLKLIRQAQWRWDYAAASHGAAFHAPVETLRVLSGAIAKGQEARVDLSRILSKYGKGLVAMPDISTKEKAQKYIGLDMPKLKAEKEEFLRTIVPGWINQYDSKAGKQEGPVASAE
jgi:nitrite reductase (cytochrome c-552)